MDGFVAGLWRWEQSGSHALLTMEAFAPLTPATAEELQAEGRRLLHFLAEDAQSHEAVLQHA